MRISLFTLSVLILAALLPVTARAQGHHGPTPAPAAPSGHNGASGSEIFGLGPDEIAELRSGQGMGQARVADVQGYPGPRHVLDAEKAGELQLSGEQAARVQEIYRSMASEARRLGDLVLAAEQDLALAFRNGGLDATSLAERVERVALLRGALRTVHLRAHLETRAVLDPGQIARYMALRGYAPAGESPSPGHRMP